MKKNGYLMMEIMIGLAVILILASVLVPVWFKSVERANLAKAKKDIEMIVAAVTDFNLTQKLYPISDGSSPRAQVFDLMFCGSWSQLPSDGTKDQLWAPRLLAIQRSFYPERQNLMFHLLFNDPNANGLIDKGDYENLGGWPFFQLPSEGCLDPWGHDYLMDFSPIVGRREGLGFGDGVGWIISAGPNGVLETDPRSSFISRESDDLGKIFFSSHWPLIVHP